MRTITAGQWRGDRPPATDMAARRTVRAIIAAVRRDGDRAVREFTRRFDRVECDTLPVPVRSLAAALEGTAPGLQEALRVAAAAIGKFARRQMKQFRDFELQIEPGLLAGQRVTAIERIGVYAPGGRYPLVSSVLMGAIPARVAGVSQLALCSPPGPDGLVHPHILAAAALVGITEVYAIGGAQAIAALALGTESVPRVDKIVGPGNRYVTAAKQELAGSCGIDFAAGPTEVLIVADASADPVLVAADLLAQAEHDCRACPVLISLSQHLTRRVKEELRRQLKKLPTRQTAGAALKKNGLIIQVPDLAEAARIADAWAPEHLELHLSNALEQSGRFRHFGSLFIGAQAAEALGDYACGINHTLPTGGAGRYSGGLSVRDFIKLQTTLRLVGTTSPAAAETAATLARSEGLAGHLNALQVRFGLEAKSRECCRF